MYKSFTAEDYKTYLGLLQQTTVWTVCFAMEHGIRERQIEIFKGASEGIGKQYSYGTLPNFLEKMTEFIVEGKRYWFDVSYGGAMLSGVFTLGLTFWLKENILLGSCGGLSKKN